MRLRWTANLLAVLGIVAMAPPAWSQGLNEVLSSLLSNGCSALGSNVTGELARICSGGGATASGGATATPETRGAEVGQAARRLRQRQAAASADPDGMQGLSFFATADYQKFDKDTTRFETGFDRDTVGGTVGADYLFRSGLVLGTALHYAHEFGDYDGGGGFDHNAYGILAYGSVVPIPNMFVDVSAGYTRKNYSFDRRVDAIVNGNSVTGIAKGDTDGNEFGVGVNTGYDFVLGRFTVGPRLGVAYRDITMNDYHETGDSGLELAYNNQNIRSLTTAVGLFGSAALSTGFGVIVPQAGVEYVHEFLDDQRSVSFRLAQDLSGNHYLYQTDSPDRDYVNLGVGVSMVLANGFQPFLNFRELLGYRDRSSHTVTVGLRIPF
jgi:outer membrane autotransporter protein